MGKKTNKQKQMWELKEKIQLLPKMNAVLPVTLLSKHSQIKPLSIFTCNLQMCECAWVFVYPCRPTPLSFYYMGQWVHHLSSFTPLLSQTSHIARRDGDDVGGRGRGGVGVTTHIICLRAAQTAWPQPLSPLRCLQHLTFGPNNLTFLWFTGYWQYVRQ